MVDMRLFSELAHNLKWLNFTNHFIRVRENPPSGLQNKHEAATQKLGEKWKAQEHPDRVNYLYSY